MNKIQKLLDAGWIIDEITKRPANMGDGSFWYYVHAEHAYGEKAGGNGPTLDKAFEGLAKEVAEAVDAKFYEVR